MSFLSAKQNFKHGSEGKIGVLLCNLGTPDQPTTKAVRKYLAEFLSDRRVVELHPWLWKPILHGIILRIRPKRSAQTYEKIWREDGSPLLCISNQQLAELQQRHPELVIDLGMRYGQPSIPAAMHRMREANVRRLLVLPMYPQYASATTGSMFDAVSRELQSWRWVPDFRFITEYHINDDYIEALAHSIQSAWETSGRGEILLMSFHGIPEECFLAGDPYFCQCQATARTLAEKLNLGANEWQISFQSRFGPKQWLTPYTDASLVELAKSGTKRVDLVCPGFAADCLETLEEIAILNAEVFTDAGGEHLNYIPALNNDDQHLDAISRLIETNLMGWDRQENSMQKQARQSGQQRAEAMMADRNLLPKNG